MTRRSSAFTLIELLVVTSIIALLVALLLPALGKARETSRVAVCLANLRQYNIAAAAYTNDFKGYFPLGAMLDTSNSNSFAHRWYIAMGPYLNNDAMPDSTIAQMTNPTVNGKSYGWDYQNRGRSHISATDGGFATRAVSSFGKSNIYTCPSTTGVVESTTVQPGPFPGGFDVDYTINGCVTGYYTSLNRWYQVPKRNITNPGVAFSFVDGNAWTARESVTSYSYPTLGVAAEQTTTSYAPLTWGNGFHVTRHNDMTTANVAFFDGHAEGSWNFLRFAEASYGTDAVARNNFWRGDASENLVNALKPY